MHDQVNLWNTGLNRVLYQVLRLWYANVNLKSLEPGMLLSKVLWQWKPFFISGHLTHWGSWEPDLKNAAPPQKNVFIWSYQLWKINFRIQQQSINQKLNLPDKTLEFNNAKETVKWLYYVRCSVKSKCLQIWFLEVFKFM